MATIHRLDYCGMAGEGATVAQAKADAARKLSALVEDCAKGPRVVVVTSLFAFIWRESYGWAYKVVNADGGLPKPGRLYGSHGIETEDAAVAQAVTHLADLSWRHTVEDDAAFAAECTAGHQLLRHADAQPIARDLVHRWAWQRRYRAVRDLGHPDVTCHHIAGFTRTIEEARTMAEAKQEQPA